MHVYLGYIFRCSVWFKFTPQSRIHLWKTITPNKFQIYKNAHIPREDFQMKCMAQVYPLPN